MNAEQMQPGEVRSSEGLGRLVDAAGLVNLLGMGGASCVHTEGCAGVAQADLERLVALVCAEERERWRGKLADCAKHMEDNAQALKKYPGCEQETRARELAASYVAELANLAAMEERLLAMWRPNAEFTGCRRQSGATPG